MSKGILTLDDVDTSKRTVLVRLDINSPVDPISNKILDDTRIKMHIPTLNDLKDARVVILAHQSRPGKSDYTTMEEHAKIMSKYLRRDIEYIDELLSKRVIERIKAIAPGEILMLENTRFYAEEVSLKSKSPEDLAKTHIVKKLGGVADIFVNDAFAAAHRAQPTLVGFGEVMPMVAGRLMEHEISALMKVTNPDDGPVIGILGGAKIDDSIAVARNLLDSGRIDKLILTGVVANAFLIAGGIDIGKKNTEFVIQCADGNKDVIDMAREILNRYSDKVLMPLDVGIERDGTRHDTDIEDLKGCEWPIYDIGIRTIEVIRKEINNARYLFLNGPAGYFEKKEFSIGTYEIFRAIASSNAYAVLGGGHTSAVVDSLGIKDKVGHISSGGGAFINFLAGRPMPVIDALRRSYNRYMDGYYKKT